VLTPEGLVLDIEGVHTIQDWLDRWLEGEEHFAHEWNNVKFLVSRTCTEPFYEHVPAKEWAPKVLAAYRQLV